MTQNRLSKIVEGIHNYNEEETKFKKQLKEMFVQVEKELSRLNFIEFILPSFDHRDQSQKYTFSVLTVQGGIKEIILTDKVSAVLAKYRHDMESVVYDLNKPTVKEIVKYLMEEVPEK